MTYSISSPVLITQLCMAPIFPFIIFSLFSENESQCSRPYNDFNQETKGSVPLRNMCVFYASSFWRSACAEVRLSSRQFGPTSNAWVRFTRGPYRKLTVLIKPIPIYPVSRDSDWLRAGQQRGRSSSPCRVKNFLFSTSSRPALGPTQPHTQWVPGALSPGVKRPGREADHSPPTTTEIKKTWIYTSTLPYAFMAQCLIS
jgi:hypothetical protein